jgi:hypothetical protein
MIFNNLLLARAEGTRAVARYSARADAGWERVK